MPRSLYLITFSLLLMLLGIPVAYGAEALSSPPAKSGEALATGPGLHAQLDPILKHSAAELRQRVTDGPPFRLTERRGRLDRLDALLNDGTAQPAEKFRQTFEAYRIELDYARAVEADRDLLEADGRSRLVDFLIVGRLALYYQTLDGRESGLWLNAERRWQRVSGEDNEKIAKGLRAARKLEPPLLLTLPLPVPAALAVEPSNPVSAAESRSSAGVLPGMPAAAKPSPREASLLAEVRTDAVTLKAGLDQRYTPREPALRALFSRLADPNATPLASDVESLFAALQRQLDELGRVSRFRETVYAPDGSAAVKEVLRVGDFGLIADGHYLIYAAEVDRLLELTRQPSDELLQLAEDFVASPPRSLAPLGIDPSGGQTLQLLVQVPRLGERLRQGGAVGYLIIVLGVLALLLATYRFAALTRAEQRIRRQIGALPEIRADNPLGRILKRLDGLPSQPSEALDIALDEGLLVEGSQLDRYLPLLRLLAAITPMLGLLGTVTGMIATFQVIALHGTGDPKLMSGGISEALVTTVLGLVTAIPILLLHSVLASKRAAIVTLLEAHGGAALVRRLRLPEPAAAAVVRDADALRRSLIR